MNSNPKIIVLKMREIIYTVVLVFLVALLILCIILMFSRKQESSTTSESITESAQTIQETQESVSSAHTVSQNTVYTPGIYTSSITLGDSAIDVEVTVDSNQIKDVRLVNLSEAVAASYPLISSSLENIAAQILQKQSLNEITSPQTNRYTSQLLLSAVSDALMLARCSKE